MLPKRTAAVAGPPPANQSFSGRTAPVESKDVVVAAAQLMPIPPSPSMHNPPNADARQGSYWQDQPGKFAADSPFEAVNEAGTIKLSVQRPLLLKTKADIYRTDTVDKAICAVERITSKDVSLVGRAPGRTHVTFFFEDPATPQLTYLVDVQADTSK
jgi:hypothetical protein